MARSTSPDLIWQRSLTELGLIDEYRLYFPPSCLGAASRTSPARGRRFGLSPAMPLARTR